jgi:hypothetical protein
MMLPLSVLEINAQALKSGAFVVVVGFTNENSSAQVTLCKLFYSIGSEG